MGRMYRILDEDYSEHYNQRENDLERAFKEGCEYGYKKAKRDLEGYNERSHYDAYNRHKEYDEGFEEKLSRLKRKYE